MIKLVRVKSVWKPEGEYPRLHLLTSTVLIYLLLGMAVLAIYFLLLVF